MASSKLVAFAQYVTAGHSPTKAAQLAGYKESYARRYQSRLMAQARDAELLPGEDEAHDAMGMIVEALLNKDGGAAFRAMWDKILSKAVNGDLRAAQMVTEYLVGKPGQSIDVTATVDTEQTIRYKMKWPEDAGNEDADG